MTPDEGRAERARLVKEIANATAAEAFARVEYRKFEQMGPELEKDRTDLLIEHARKGHEDSDGIAEELDHLRHAIDAVPRALAEQEAAIAAAARARRDAETELHYLLVDQLPTFLGDAGNLAEDAEAKLAAVAPAVAEAARAHQQAQIEYAKLAKPVAEALRAEDEAQGVYPPEGQYQQATRMPPFPLAVINEYIACPSGVQKLAKNRDNAAPGACP